MSPSNPGAKQLACGIARCPIMVRAVQDKTYATACRKVVHYQQSASLATHELPEPWSGHIETAPILFISSNPSIGPGNEPSYPHNSWEDDKIYQYFDQRFRDSIIDGIYIDETRTYWVRFWAGVKQRAIELLQRTPEYGKDYALTEAVHCKSRNECGVKEALETCTSKWLQPVLETPGADILIVLGTTIRDTMKRRLGVPGHVTTTWGPAMIYGRSRYVVFLPHTNAHGPRSFQACIPADEIQALRQFLRASMLQRGEGMLSTIVEIDNPSSAVAVIQRYIGLLEDNTCRDMIAYLANRKGRYYLTGQGNDRVLGDALIRGADLVRNARGPDDAAAVEFVTRYAGYLENQEQWEKGEHGNKPAVRFLRKYASCL